MWAYMYSQHISLDKESEWQRNNYDWDCGSCSMTKPVLPLAYIYHSELCNMIAYPNRSNTSCNHPPQPPLGCPPSHILRYATHPAMHSGYILLLPLLFGSSSSRSTIAHVQFEFHKKSRNNGQVCKKCFLQKQGHM